MYLYVLMSDNWGAYNDAMLGCGTANRNRIVKIRLTKKQTEMLKPRHCGDQSSTNQYESINPVCIQNDLP